MKKVAIIETIGGHGGTDFYLFGLCRAIMTQKLEPIVYTCDETDITNAPCTFKLLFKNIYGKDNVLIRGVRFFWGAIHSIIDCEKNKYNLVHVHVYAFNLRELFILKICKMIGFKIAITIHDIECVETFSRGKKQKNSHDRFLTQSDAVVIHTEFAKSKLLEKTNVYAEKLFVVPGYDTDTVNLQQYREISSSEARKKIQIPKDKKIVLYFGQIRKTKGVDILINAFPKVVADFPDALLVIAGKVLWEEGFGRYEKLISEQNIQNNVIARIEYIPNEDVPYYFRAADIMVLPYIKSYNSGVMIRALSLGVPIICSNEGPFPEFIEDGENGYLFTAGDSESLAEKINMTFAHSESSNTMKANAINYFDTFFALPKVGEKTLAAYTKALE